MEVADEGQIIVLQPGKHSVGSRAVVLDKRLRIEGVRKLSSLPDPHALVPRIRDQDRLKNPDTTKTDLEYDTDAARVFSDYGTPAIVIAGSGIEVVGITLMQRVNFKIREDNRPLGEHAMATVEIQGGSCFFTECTFSSDAGINFCKVLLVVISYSKCTRILTFENVYLGISCKVSCGASPLFRKCKFEFSRLQGLWFGSRSTGRVEDCIIMSCTEANLQAMCTTTTTTTTNNNNNDYDNNNDNYARNSAQVEGQADPVISRCKIFSSFTCGVRVTDRGKGMCVPHVFLMCS